MGLGPGPALGAVTALQGEGATAAVVSGAVAGVSVGLVLGPMVHRQIRRQTEAVGVLDTRTRRAVGWASLCGAGARGSRGSRGAQGGL